jgi:starch synthase
VRESVRPRIVFSVHNLEYQGLFDRATFDALELPGDLWSMQGVEFYGRMSFMKGGLAFADAITAVSPTYAHEIQTPTYGFGLDGLLRHRAGRLHGILNGIDVETWNPATDRYLPARFDADDLRGKAACREALRARLRLADVDVPIAAVVSRFAGQKGMDLLLETLDRLVALPVRLAVLGSGAADLEAGFAAASARYPDRVAYVRGFDEALAHLIEAGADLFLMPSRFEPCGLNQMYSMRYGTVPVVRRTGGLADTVVAAAEPDGTGFLFDDATSAALYDAVARAVATMGDAERWRALQRAGMTRDFSWSRSAARYRGVYESLLVEH